jgi:hypothetical protein
MPSLPPDEEREALLDALAALVAARGAEPLLRAPVEPTPQFFPDAWRPDVDGARVLLRRVMDYAGLADLRSELLVETETRTELGKSTGRHTHGAVAWFHGIGGGAAVFGISSEPMGDPDQVVAALCHEVAHAYRFRNGLVGDRSTEEPSTDVTTVYLGFGIFTTNASAQSRSSGELQGLSVRHRWSQSSLGYLSPESMSFLLAAQAVVRRETGRGRRRIRNLLETNQAAYFEAACAHLLRDESALLDRLGVPPDRCPGPPPVPVQPIRELPAGDPATTRPPSQGSDPGIQNRGRPVFRVPDKGGKGLIVALGITAMGAAAAAAAVHGVWPLPVAVVVVAVLLAGRGKDARPNRSYHCSEPQCRASLAENATECAGCGGTVSGEIRREDDRLFAEEALRASRRTSAPAEGEPDMDGADRLERS